MGVVFAYLSLDFLQSTTSEKSSFKFHNGESISETKESL